MAAGETADDGEGSGGDGAAASGPLETVRLLVGSPVPGDEARSYATREGFGFTVTLGPVDVGRFIDQTREDWRPDPADSKVDALAP